MKLCLLSRYFNMTNAGIGRISTELQSRLKGMGHTIYTVADEGTTPLSYLKYSYWNIQKQIPVGMDIYHAVTPMEARWIPRRKSVVTICDLIPILHPDRAGSGLNNNFINRLVGVEAYRSAFVRSAQCSRIAVISEQTKEEVMDRLKVPERKIKLIRLGINRDLCPCVKTHNQAFRIGYLGQLDRRKRVDRLIQAFHETDIDGVLVIAGDGVDKDKLWAMAEGDPRIRFLGFLPDEMLPDFYNSLDLFVFPTWIEGYGLPIVEALACQTPVAVLEDAIIPREVKSRCIVAPDLKEVLEWASQHMPVVPEETYQWARSHDWSVCVAEYEKLYKEVI